MSVYREQFAAALGAAAVRGPTQYAWLGRQPTAPGGARTRWTRPSVALSGLVPRRRALLLVLLPRAAGDGALGRAGTGAGRYVAGRGDVAGQWQPRELGSRVDVSGSTAATRWSGPMCARGCGCPTAVLRRRPPGCGGRLRLPKELLRLRPGSARCSATPRGGRVGARRPRVYWNVTPAGAPALVGALTTRLNASACRSGSRSPTTRSVSSAATRRCSTCRREFRDAAGARSGRRPRSRPHLRPEIPAFTRALAPGVGLAEDDGAPRASARRCSLLADAIVRAHEQGITGSARVAVVAARFAAGGVRIDAPYLEPSLSGRHVL